MGDFWLVIDTIIHLIASVILLEYKNYGSIVTNLHKRQMAALTP